MQEGTKWAGSVIFKLVGGIVGALVACITAIGVAIFQAVENPTGEKKNASLLDYFDFSKLFKKKPKKDSKK